MTDRVWYHGEPEGVILARLISRGAYASKISYHLGGFDREVLVSNDDIEFIGDADVDDED